ncbi:MAG: sortase, partial [Patescibacteria group bacterium]|nr:sortase [Patescibacteria group bacterium]
MQKSTPTSRLKNLKGLKFPVKSAPVKLLMVLSVLVGGYLVLMPFVPQVIFFLGNLIGEKEYYPYKTDLALGSGKNNDSVEFGKEKIPEENWLVIPCIGVDALIAEGETGDALDRGVWHRPRTGSPDSGGNMVLTAHRFKYLPPNNLTFYHLDKVRKSDKVIVYWNEIEYDYVVTEV